MSKRILLCEFYHETNSFNPTDMTLDGFKAIRLSEGKAFYDEVMSLQSNSAHGFIDAIEETGATVVPSISMFGCAGGVVTDEALVYFKDRLAHYLETESYDAVFCSLHGATVTESDGDACGNVLAFIREKVGQDMVVAACFDLHANMTQRVLANCDIISGYQTYPHVDFYETGYRAGKMGMEKVMGETLYLASLRIPVLTPPSGYTTLESPFKDMMKIGFDAISSGEIEDFSFFNVQPWMDISEIASSVIVVSKDRDTALAKASEIGKRFFEIKDRLWPDLMDLDDIIDIAEDPSVPKPVVIGDSADSPNSGSIGDSAVHAMRLKERGSKLSLCLFVRDEEVVAQAFKLGVGAEADFEVGGKYTPGMPGPFKGHGKVRSLHDGRFVMEGPGGRGTAVSIGLAAVISFDSIDMMVCQLPIESGDPQILRHFGIEPTFYDLVVVKANTSFRVPYGKFAGRICYADTPGVGASNLKRFKWKNLPKGLYPFDLPDGYSVVEPSIVR